MLSFMRQTCALVADDFDSREYCLLHPVSLLQPPYIVRGEHAAAWLFAQKVNRRRKRRDRLCGRLHQKSPPLQDAARIKEAWGGGG